MNKTTVKEYLAEVAELVEDSIHEAAVESTENGAVLHMTASSPFKEGEEISYSVSVEEFKGDMYIFRTVILAFINIPEKSLEDVSAVIAELNPRIVFGSFILAEELGAVMFSHSFLLDETVTTMTAARILLKSISLMENAVFNAGQWIYDLLDGKYSVSEIKAALNEEGEGND